MIKPLTMSSLVGLNAFAIRGRGDNKNMANPILAIDVPPLDAGPGSAADVANINAPRGFSGAFPIRSRGTTGQQDE